MKDSRPNILFLVADDQRFDTIHALGNPDIQTPNLDRLVSGGTAFTHAHIPCGTSGAVCMPSRAMFHTGRTLFHLDREGQGIPPEHTTLGEAFQQAGYHTFGTGKWHNETASFARSFCDGSSIFFGGMWDHWNVPVCDYDPTGRYNRTSLFTTNFFASNRTNQMHCDRVVTGCHSTELIAGTARQFLESYDGEKPFLLYVSFLAPHDPRTMPDKFRKMYDPAAMKVPDNFQPEHPFDFGIRQIRDEVLAPYPRTEEEIRRHIAEYYAMISHLDHEVGTILNTLEQRGLKDNTLVVFIGDNGLAVGRHGLMGKQNHYEHSVRIPLLFAGPGIPAGLRLSAYAYLLDIFPTLCRKAGIPVPASVEGLDLSPVMVDPARKVRESLYFAYTDQVRSVKDERYKLIRYAGVHRGTQLFDLQADPSEMVNLAGQPAIRDIQAGLESLLLKYRDEWDDMRHPMGAEYWSR